MTLKLLENEGDFVRFEALGKITRDGWAHSSDPLASTFGDGIYKRKCLLSLSHAFYIDSTGVEWLLNSHQKFARDGGLLILHSPTPASRQLLRVMRVDLVLNIVGNEQDAIKLAHQREVANGKQA